LHKFRIMAQKILIIRFSSIGDIVLTTPVIRCLKTQLKDDVEIHFLTKSTFKTLLSSNPHISAIHTINKDVSEISQELKKENFDTVIDLHHNLRSAITKKIIGKKSFSFEKINIQKWIMVNFKIDKLPPVHIVDRYMKCVESLGIKNDGAGLDYFIPAEDEVDLSTLPSSFQNGFVGFVIGAKHNTKMMPIEKLISTCKSLKKPVVLLGGTEDMERAEVIVQELGESVYNACGKYHINQSASLVRQANKIISHDTGLMHIASAFNKDIVSIWGNTIPQFGMSPYMPSGNSKSTIIEVKDLGCRPCTKIGYSKCPKGHFKCMMDIDVGRIAAAVN